jgi:hypothetical protein
MTLAADNLDALSGPAFDALYEGQIRPALQKCEARRGQAMAIFVGVSLAGIGLAALEVMSRLPFQLALFTVIGGGVLGWLPLGKLQAETKQAVIAALCGPLGVTYQLNKFHAPGWELFLNLRLLPSPTSFTVQDLFVGQRAGSNFSLCETTITQGSGKSRRVVFSGQLMRIASPRPFAGTTVVLRDSGWLDRFQCPPGMKKVGLEDPHFEKIFEVFGDDQVEARVLLTPIFMDQLLALEQVFAGKHIRCGFCEGDFLVAVEGPNRFEIGGMFSSLVERSRVDHIVGDLRVVIQLIDVFLQVRP